MRQKRTKAYRKLMALYGVSFGFRQPYQVLLDSEICNAATLQKLDIVKCMRLVLQGEIKPMITQCCIYELYLQGRDHQPAVDLAKTFERRKCNHREAIAGDECLQSVVGDTNKHRYIIATQSQPLRAKLRNIPATPLVHINRSVMILEPPSDATLEAKHQAEERALHATASEMEGGAKTEEPQRKRKGPKGPNPLSVKKKKVQISLPSMSVTISKNVSRWGEKRKRLEDEDAAVNKTLTTERETKRKRRRKHKPTVEVITNEGT